MALNATTRTRPLESGASEYRAAGGAGLRAFANIAEHWGLTVADQLKFDLLQVAARTRASAATGHPGTPFLHPGYLQVSTDSPAGSEGRR